MFFRGRFWQEGRKTEAALHCTKCLLSRAKQYTKIDLARTAGESTIDLSLPCQFSERENATIVVFLKRAAQRVLDSFQNLFLGFTQLLQLLCAIPLDPVGHNADAPSCIRVFRSL